ncbi:2-succinyl-5-enolpyruvyl-6-hydroxy-3-cyclohexene-1-carboxylic-acid synthase [Cyanobium sp. FACHB-13342]|uniref:2-succinyl-5-enolpyruvyl-6-hydroxy-3- cyclohexene-1-carboxylic-acid synthase n=1 Tax=Cyanobium sp. FACHB-13342 TaxID=2692793 RepID=UPI0024113FDB|nr:2-succinyl-5-enolpyruvyl-6-hydroxy-3-cyclohexene-1-carboxylic-acid synthase [Cyanobium sp. FACHB-13342]
MVLLAALMRGGLTDLVLCPGSRSGALAEAAGVLETRGLVLRTAVDERSAAFFALGLARARGRAVAVVTTSGTAVANLLPAAVEADYGAIPLLLISADRPDRLKGCGANQTVNQECFLAASVRWRGQADGAGLGEMGEEEIVQLACRALAATQAPGQAPGPVHLNLPFDEPLHADGPALLAVAVPQVGVSMVQGSFLSPAAIPSLNSSPMPDLDQAGVVVAGPWRGLPQHREAHVAALVRLQRRTGWPVLADGLSGLRGLPQLQMVAGYDLLLDHPDGALQPPPQVLRLGPLPASRRLQRWLAHPGPRQWLVSEGDPRCLDPLGSACPSIPSGLAGWLASWPERCWEGQPSQAALELAAAWSQREGALQGWLDHSLPGGDGGEPGLARALGRLLPADLPLVIANSSPVRDWESFGDPAAPGRPVFAFRGASGIDGTLSIACGVAAALGQAVLLTGDLALLHDSHGWLWQGQLGGRLTVILLNNGGGGIFEQLPIRTTPEQALDFDRLFAMPQPVDHLALAAAHGVPGRRVEGGADLASQLSWALEQPMALLEVVTDRRADAARRQELRRMASSSWSQS